MNSIYLLLGSNQGNRTMTLDKARNLLGEQLGAITCISPLYETAAWGNTQQPNFINQALQLSTKHNPIEALRIINQIENQLGRQRTEHWGQRTLDIDILLFEDKIIHSSRLVIPHPELQNRRFALVPLCDIAPELAHPIFAKSIKSLLADCSDQLGVFLYHKG
ncbi:MAG: 2-amino-4-hydroxy-6-hydroxymethyldihydropteridine diphosphokinase [Phycisphaerales bacterium]|nr:2-amino-4-hydroxy-6-hydroxymethyldihydropteridine diphosphokinase [Phycisphaerales bacterium]